MKLKLSVLAVFAAITFLSPMIVFVIDKKPQSATTEKSQTELTLQDTATNTQIKVDLNEYLYGALAAEVPATYSPEALKAQAIACRTYALKCKQSPDANLNGADLSYNSSTRQGYIPTDNLKDLWKENYSTYYKNICDAVNATQGLVIAYDNALIVPAYHSISSGKTESSQDIWQQSVPYLVSVDCPFDLLATDYLTHEKFSPQDLKTALADLNITFTDTPESWFANPVQTAASAVQTIDVCGTSLTGAKLRSALGLRSAAFTVTFADGSFDFQVMGYGHGVGMSQNGANHLANQGKNANEILTYFYTGATVVDSSSIKA